MKRHQGLVKVGYEVKIEPVASQSRLKLKTANSVKENASNASATPAIDPVTEKIASADIPAKPSGKDKDKPEIRKEVEKKVHVLEVNQGAQRTEGPRKPETQSNEPSPLNSPRQTTKVVGSYCQRIRIHPNTNGPILNPLTPIQTEPVEARWNTAATLDNLTLRLIEMDENITKYRRETQEAVKLRPPSSSSVRKPRSSKEFVARSRFPSGTNGPILNGVPMAVLHGHTDIDAMKSANDAAESWNAVTQPDDVLEIVRHFPPIADMGREAFHRSFDRKQTISYDAVEPTEIAEQIGVYSPTRDIQNPGKTGPKLKSLKPHSPQGKSWKGRTKRVENSKKKKDAINMT